MRTAKDSGGCSQQLGGFRSDELLVEGMWRLEACMGTYQVHETGITLLNFACCIGANLIPRVEFELHEQHLPHVATWIIYDE